MSKLDPVGLVANESTVLFLTKADDIALRFITIKNFSVKCRF